MKSWRGKHYFHRGRKFWDNSLWGVCKITFFYFFLNWFPRNPTLLDSAIQKLGSLPAGQLESTDLNSLPTCLILIGAVESTDILMEVYGLCRLSITQKQTGRKHQPKHQPSTSTSQTSTNQKKQISLAGKSIQHFFLLLIWETSRLIHKGFLRNSKKPKIGSLLSLPLCTLFSCVLWCTACQDHNENPQLYISTGIFTV